MAEETVVIDPPAAAPAEAPAPAPTPSYGGFRGRDDRAPRETDGVEKVVHINRCAKVVKGGRRFSFSALVVSGDAKGKVGCGFGKANEVSDAIKKATEASRKNMFSICLKDSTIPHEVVGSHGGGHILLKPATAGTGIIAGGGARAVLEAAGVKDVIGKSLGSSNHANVVRATLAALTALRPADEILRARGKEIKERKAL
ncbi:MAG: 30S ribosomal protein S5 [Prosthecobacter sp.]|jgi:small subunit ribosomal protein S5|uniref:30S ribosomal protein S5 n=1 Tax=Prosthecobacter sp. TaxID=1965333 RepID=UPI003BB0C617